MTTASPARRDVKARIGISSCLLGTKVRFDGGHKRDEFLTETFGRWVEWVPVCPEVEAGLGVPRETMRQVRATDGIRLLMPKSGVDHTALLHRTSERRARTLGTEQLSGFVLKKDSPTCGLERVKVYDGSGAPARKGVGLFAAAVMKRYPDLPVEEEGRLTDPRLRDNFVERVFAYQRVKLLFAGRWSIGDLVRFHTAHKLAVLAHSPSAYQALGRLVAKSKKVPRGELADRYTSELMQALRVMATPSRHTNVLQHMLGYLRRVVDQDSRSELRGSIADYKCGLVPLIVPITLLKHHLRRHKVEYLLGQTYLDPHPKELMLRNHV